MGGLTFNTSFSDILILIKYIFMGEIMKKYKKILITGMAILASTTASLETISAINVYASNDTRTVKKLSPNSDYPNIKSKFDVTNMTQYSDDDLFGAVTLNKFYVKSVGADPMKQYHVLLTPTKHSSQYFLLVTKSKKKIRLHDKLTAQVALNGSSKINDAQINSGISESYSGKHVILTMPDKIAVYHK